MEQKQDYKSESCSALSFIIKVLNVQMPLFMCESIFLS